MRRTWTTDDLAILPHRNTASEVPVTPAPYGVVRRHGTKVNRTGYEITTVLSDGSSIGSVRVGTNGSHEVMFGPWFAAYGVSGLPDSDRVRRGWVQP